MADVQRLVRNLIAMHELLRDAEHVSLRLVMTPDRMVVAEAMRTFTYLNLYGYLCDAVVVNRVFPEDAGEYFGAWREVQAEQLELTWSPASRRCRCCARRTSSRRCSARRCSTGSATRCSHGRDADARCCTTGSTQELTLDGSRAELRLDLPFVSKGDMALKKIGLELVVRVDGQKRTIVLPGALAGLPADVGEARRRDRSSWGSSVADADGMPRSVRRGRAADARGRGGGAAGGRRATSRRAAGASPAPMRPRRRSISASSPRSSSRCAASCRPSWRASSPTRCASC